MRTGDEHLNCNTMMKSAGRIGRKKTSRPFKDFYAEWIDSLRSTLLPLLRHSMSAAAAALHGPSADLVVSHRGLLGGAMVSSSHLLLTHVHTIHAHFQAYFQALDLAARHDASQVVSPEWRNSLEKPFLWLGDFHPALLTNLLRSFLDHPSSSGSGAARSHPFALAWRNPSGDLIARVEQIECGLELMVPALVKRARDAQAGFMESAAAEWAACGGRTESSPKTSDGALAAPVGELAGVFGDANRLRRSILSEIMGALDVYQAALYLEALSQFVVGFRDADLLRDFEQSKMVLSPRSAS